MNTDEAIEIVVEIAETFLTMTNGVNLEWIDHKKTKEAIKVLEGLKPSNIIDEVVDKEMNTRKKRLQLCGKHEHPNDYVPFPDDVEGIPHPD